MFENVGAKIKTVSKVFCWVGITVSLIVALIMCYMASKSYSDAGFYIGMGWMFFIVFPLLSWISSLTVYGFGELIERTAAIAEYTAYGNLIASKQKSENSNS